MNNPNQKTLGRGLSSLINNQTQNRPLGKPTEAPYFPKTKQGVSNQILQVPINQISSNPHQPRKEFAENPLQDLVASIKEHGILQPIVVTQTMAGNYELIAGERRLRAAKLAGLKEISVIIRTAKDLEKLELSLIENIQRQDLNPIEKANAYKKLIDNFSLTHEDAAKRLGISRAQLSNIIRLLNLPAEVQKGLASNKISLGQAKVLLEIKDENKQEQIYKRATQIQQTVEDTKRQVQKVKVRPHIRHIKKDPQIQEWENQLQEKLNTRVHIKKRGESGGILEIEFYSEEELISLVKNIIY
ncbi:ParB/RepB/Spo0J family partition protein [Candidatus Parcubacteria bacterium]|nr:ParB/RepB/Spo0J family partition protein [Candidatus Parcubacteria bacterium]